MEITTNFEVVTLTVKCKQSIVELGYDNYQNSNEDKVEASIVDYVHLNAH